MCGIVGYTGTRPVKDILIEGLSRLEYRGYDSAGIAVEQDGALEVVHCKEGERPRAARRALNPHRHLASPTRWATHGPPERGDAHPHTSCDGRVAVVHNGIIRNFAELREELEAAATRSRARPTPRSSRTSWRRTCARARSAAGRARCH